MTQALELDRRRRPDHPAPGRSRRDRDGGAAAGPIWPLQRTAGNRAVVGLLSGVRTSAAAFGVRCAPGHRVTCFGPGRARSATLRSRIPPQFLGHRGTVDGAQDRVGHVVAPAGVDGGRCRGVRRPGVLVTLHGPAQRRPASAWFPAPCQRPNGLAGPAFACCRAPWPGSVRPWRARMARMLGPINRTPNRISRAGGPTAPSSARFVGWGPSVIGARAHRMRRPPEQG